MHQFKQFFFTALIFCGVFTTTTSCSDVDDNPIVTPDDPFRGFYSEAVNQLIDENYQQLKKHSLEQKYPGLPLTKMLKKWQD